MRSAGWVVLVVVFLAAAVAVVSAQRPPEPEYEFEIVRTSSGIRLECRHGCYWESLEGRCDEEFSNCTYVVDDRGIRVYPDPEAGRRPADGD